MTNRVEELISLHEQIEQSAILMRGLDVKPEVAYADLGGRGDALARVETYFQSERGHGV